MINPIHTFECQDCFPRPPLLKVLGWLLLFALAGFVGLIIGVELAHIDLDIPPYEVELKRGEAAR